MHALRAAGDSKTARLIQLELDGGACPECGTAWREIKTSEGQYYEPVCENCFPRCPRCSRWLYEEAESGVWKRNKYVCECGFPMMPMANGQYVKQYGKAFEVRYAAMTRWQQMKTGGVKI
jgi:hypothetical protein